MDFNAVWTAYYNLFRADSDVPTSTDDEYTVGMRMANEAINRWAYFDNTYWEALFTTNQTDGTGAQTIVTGQRTYTTATNFKEAGGFVKVLDTNGTTMISYPIIEAHEAQFKGDNGTYCYFTGNPSDGHTLHLNPAPTSNLNGKDIEYVYYMNPSLFTTGTDISEIPDPYFIVHRMLANQFRAARNPYYTSAKADAENALKQMQTANNSGTWSNPWSMGDTSGSSWGQGIGG